MDLIEVCYDEIALEGLDGITLNSLWYRLAKRRPPISVAVDESSKAYYWNIIVSLQEVEFFCLPHDRADVTDIETMFDSEARLLVYKEHPFIKMYPFYPVNSDGVRGSCATIKTRVNVTSEVRSSDYTPMLSLSQVIQRWGRKLVFVASQRRRDLALLGSSVDTTAVLPLLEGMNYQYLEAIGRSRNDGLLGTDAFEHLQVPGKKRAQGRLFYHKKVLTSMGLIFKQDYMVLKGGRYCNDNVCHLVRFYKPLKTFYIDLHDKLEEHLLGCPNLRDSKHSAFLAVDPDGKWTRFKRFIQERTDYFAKEIIPYSELYPDQPPIEEKKGAPPKTKTIACLRLIKRRVEFADDEECGDMSDEESEETPAGSAGTGAADVLPCARLRCDETVLQQLADYIHSQGPAGVSLQMIRQQFDLHTLMARNIVKALLARKLFLSFFIDKGRQREQRFRTQEFRDITVSSANFLAVSTNVPAAVLPLPTVSTPIPTQSEADKSAAATSCPWPSVSLHQETVVNIGGVADISSVAGSSIGSTGVLANVASDCTTPKASSTTATCTDAKASNAIATCPNASSCGSNSFTCISYASTSEASLSFTCNNFASSCNTPPAAALGIACQDEDTFEVFVTPTHDARGKETVGTVKKEITTSRMVERMDFIVKRVLEERVTTFAAIAKELKLSEASRYKDQVDRRSLRRLIERLARENRIRSYNTVVQAEGKEKELHYICEPSMLMEDRQLQSIIEQERYALLTSKLAVEQRLELKRKRKEMASEAADGELTADFIMRHPLDASMGKVYGYQPRFRRLEILHRFLWYLTYGYKGCTTGVSADGVSTVYVDEVSWKRYVPPLPDYTGVNRGWCILADAVARMPVSVFLHLVRVPYKIDGMQELLADPLKAVMLVRDLPDDMRCVLMYRRHHATCIYQLAQLMCAAGLLTFGRATSSFKDMVYIYIHRNVSVKDTTTVSQGYAVCESSEPLPVGTYHLTCEDALSGYWRELQYVCINTPLGHKLHAKYEDTLNEGRTVLTKHSLQHLFKPHTPSEVVDDGSFRGDGLGAGGLDSCFFSHRMANWVNNQQYKKSSQRPPSATEGAVQPSERALATSTAAARTGRLPRLEVSENKWLRLSTVTAYKRSLAAQEEPVSMSISVMPVTIGGREQKLGQGKSGGGPAKKRKLSDESVTVKRKPGKKRKELAEDASAEEIAAIKNHFDETDMQALRNMTTLRAVWSPPEDFMLLLCKVALMMLNAPHRLELLRDVRDWLHANCQATRDKSSRACQRRLSYLLRTSDEAKRSVRLLLAYAMKDKEILEFHQRRVKTPSCVLTKAFKDVMELLLKFKYESTQQKQVILLPDSLGKFQEKYEVENPYLAEYNAPDDLSTSEDVQTAVLTQSIIGYLLTNDKTSRTNEMQHILSHYSEETVDRVVSLMRSNRLLTRPKIFARKKMHLPQIQQYHLSSLFHHAFVLTSRFHKDHYRRTWADYCQLARCESDERDNVIAAPCPKASVASAADIASTSQARCLVVTTLVAQDKAELDFKLPDIVPASTVHSIAGEDMPVNSIVPRHLCRVGSATQYLVLQRVQQAMEQPPSDSFHEEAAVQQLYPLATARSILDPIRSKRERSHSRHFRVAAPTGEDVDSDDDRLPATTPASQRPFTVAEGGYSAPSARLPSVRAVEDRTNIAGSDSQSHVGFTNVSARGCSRNWGSAGDAESQFNRSRVTAAPTEADQAWATNATVDSNPMLQIGVGIVVKAGCALVPSDSAVRCNRRAGLPSTGRSNIVQRLTKVLPLPIPDYLSCRERLAKSDFPPDSLATVDEIYALVHASGVSGAMPTSIKEKFSHVSTLPEILQAMMETDMILRVGVTQFCYVSLSNGNKWIAKSLRDTKGRGSTGSGAEHGMRVADRTDNSPPDDFRRSTYEPRNFVPRMWRKPDGSLNTAALADVLSGVMTFVMMAPACNFTRLLEKYRQVLAPVSLMELVEVLQQLGCVRLEEVHLLTKSSLFSKPSEISRKAISAEAMTGQTCIIPVVDCVLRLGQFLEQLGV